MREDEDLVPGEYTYTGNLPKACNGHLYRMHRHVLDVPSRQQKVLVECLSGPDRGIWFVCSTSNFRLRYASVACENGTDVA